MITLDKIKEKINLIASEGYKDGSSTKKGYLYSSIPFEEFSNTPKHKNTSNYEYKFIKDDFGDFKDKRVLDIGCANGYFSFNIAKEGAFVVGYEGDSFVHDVNIAVQEYKNIKSVSFINKYFELNDALGFKDNEFDVIIMLNIHMWINKQIGFDKTKKLMSILSKKCKKMYFQTVHAEAEGKIKVDQLKSAIDVETYLYDVGFDKVNLLCKNNKWFDRLLFVCEND